MAVRVVVARAGGAALRVAHGQCGAACRSYAGARKARAPKRVQAAVAARGAARARLRAVVRGAVFAAVFHSSSPTI